MKKFTLIVISIVLGTTGILWGKSFFQTPRTIIIERTPLESQAFNQSSGLGAVAQIIQPIAPTALPPKDETSAPQNQFEQERKEIIDYFSKISDVAVPHDEYRVRNALQNADEGDFAAISEIIAKYKTAYRKIEAITPPQTLKDIHKDSLEVVAEFVILLQDIKQKQGSAEELWNGARKQTIAERAKRVNTRIREIIKTYSLEGLSSIIP